MSEYAQTIVVASQGDHLGVVAAAARATILCFAEAHEDDDRWAHWLSGPFAKVVKRTSPAKVRRLAQETAGAILHESDSALAVALPPMLPDERPPLAVKAQAAGFERPIERAVTGEREGWVVVLDANLGMTTGKAAAQAAHAALAAVLVQELTPLQAREFAEALTFEWLPQEQMQATITQATMAVPIRDAGRTEIAPGSLTAVALRLPS